jgi:hypothetical protein
MWTLDKFVNPNHAAAVDQNFYLISGLSNQMFYIIGAIQLIIILGFVAGFQKRWTYWLDRHWIDWGWESRESHESQNQLT